MAKSGGPTVGLDIGSSMIKVAEVAPGRNGVTVRAMGMAPTPPGAMESNVIVDAKLLGDAVKKLLREAGCSSKASVSSVSGQSALVVRVIEVPKMSDAELAETMRWEVERHVPFPANEVIMDFKVIERTDDDPNAQNMEVLLAVAQQDMVDRHVEMLFAAGLSPAAIDVEPLAASRALIEIGPDPYARRTIAIINIGHSNTDVGIYRDGILAFPRTLPLAGDNLTRNIMAQMGVDEEQAEELKRKYGEVLLDQFAQPQPAASLDDAFLDFSVPAAPEPPAQPGRMPFDFSDPNEPPAVPQVAAEPEPAPVTSVPAHVEAMDPTKLQVCSAMAPVLGEMLTELRRSLEYYRGRATDGTIDEVLLCGGTAKLKNIDQFLSQELGIPTRIADPLQYASLAAKNFSREYLEDIAPSFVVAVGLATRDMVAGPAPVASGGRKRGKK